MGKRISRLLVRCGGLEPNKRENEILKLADVNSPSLHENLSARHEREFHSKVDSSESEISFQV